MTKSAPPISAVMRKPSVYIARAPRPALPANVMAREDVAGKARGLLAPTLGAHRARQLIEAIWNIKRMPDLRQLHSLLRPK